MFGIAASLIVDRRFAADQRGLTLSIITAQNGASCTAVSWRIGLALASQGLRTLLVDVEAAWPPAAAWMGQLTDRLPWEESDDGTIVIGAPRPPTRRSGPFVGRVATKEVTPYTGPWKSGLYLCSEAPPVSSQKQLRAVFHDLENTFDVVLVNRPRSCRRPMLRTWHPRPEPPWWSCPTARASLTTKSSCDDSTSRRRHRSATCTAVPIATSRVRKTEPGIGSSAPFTSRARRAPLQRVSGLKPTS